MAFLYYVQESHNKQALHFCKNIAVFPSVLQQNFDGTIVKLKQRNYK